LDFGGGDSAELLAHVFLGGEEIFGEGRTGLVVRCGEECLVKHFAFPFEICVSVQWWDRSVVSVVVLYRFPYCFGGG
jgi:hypothetical protein